MNKLITLLLAASALVTLSANAADIQAPKPNSAYAQDGRGVVVRNPYGLCWRTGYWVKTDAIGGCDDAYTTTTTTTTTTLETVATTTTTTLVAKALPTAEKVTFAADALFDFDKSVLKSEGKAKIDDFASKLQTINLEVIIATGHTDSVGKDEYNQKLSIRRAEAVKAYIVSKGVEGSRVYTEGKGEKQPVADNKSSAGRAKNRRVEIEIVGTKK